MSLTFFDQNTFLEKPEDLIIAKLFYGSSQDYDDAKSIVFRQSNKLDFQYLREIAKQEKIGS